MEEFEGNNHKRSLDVDDLQGLISEKTKAIIPVHMLGVAPNLEAILKISTKRGICVVDDSCLSISILFITVNLLENWIGWCH